MRRLICLALELTCLLGTGIGTAHELNGEMTLRTFGRVSGKDPRLTDAGTRIQLRYEHHREDFSVYAEGRFRWNSVFLGDNPYSDEAREAYEASWDLREAYVQVPTLGFDWSLGWQQVVWGKADQLRILDQVNPLDLREFVLLDLHDYRRPIPMVRANRMVGDWETELLWIPTFVKTSFAKPGSEFDIPLLSNPEGVRLLQREEYDAIEEGSEVGARIARSFEGLDITLVAFYTRDDEGVFRQSLSQDVDGPVELQEQHPRYFLGGASFAAPVGNATVLRGEFSYVPARTFMVDDLTGDGLERRGEVSAMLGLDYTYGDWLLTLQALDRYVIDWRSQFRTAEHTPTFTITVEGTNFDARLQTRVFWATMPVTNDGSWLQMKNTYRFDDHWSSALIVDLLFGPDSGFFGQFDDRDRVGLEVSYRF
ncbi:MAG: DUF1302 family protein [Gammaproteobacteria bacterium]